MKTNTTLIAFAIIYNAVILSFVYIEAPLAFIMLFPPFLSISAVVLCVMLYYRAAQVNTIWDKVMLLFSTPFPLLMVGWLSSLIS